MAERDGQHGRAEGSGPAAPGGQGSRVVPQGGHRARFGLTTMCVGLGMGGTVLWENLNA